MPSAATIRWCARRVRSPTVRSSARGSPTGKPMGQNRVTAESDRDQRLYDDLGPLARAAIRNNPRIVNVASVVLAFRNQCDPEPDGGDGFRPIVLTDERYDRGLADFIERITVRAT